MATKISNVQNFTMFLYIIGKLILYFLQVFFSGFVSKNEALIFIIQYLQ